MGSTGNSSHSEYIRTIREINDGSPEYREAKEYIINHGRGLGSADTLSEQEKRILSIIDDKAISTKVPLTLYRTDDTHWLQNAQVGDVLPVRNIMQMSMLPNKVTPENEGRVVQRIVAEVPTGTRVFNANNGEEQQLDIVRNQNYTVVSKTVDKNGVNVYRIRIK